MCTHPYYGNTLEPDFKRQCRRFHQEKCQLFIWNDLKPEKLLVYTAQLGKREKHLMIEKAVAQDREELVIRHLKKPIQEKHRIYQLILRSS